MFAGARHAAVKAKRRNAAAARQKAADLHKKEHERIEKVFKLYDKDKTGKLNKDELKTLMKDYGGREPTEDEVTFVMKMSDEGKTGYLTLDEVSGAIKCWRSYNEPATQARILKTFAQYDTDNSGKLDKEQLKKCLSDLNDQQPVEDGEVEWVLSNADVIGDGQISKIELGQAIAYWFVHVDEEEAKEEAAEKKAKSRTCDIL